MRRGREREGVEERVTKIAVEGSHREREREREKRKRLGGESDSVWKAPENRGCERRQRGRAAKKDMRRERERERERKTSKKYGKSE